MSRSCPDQVPDDYQARRYANTSVQRVQAGRECNAGDPFNKGQPRANCAAGLILVGLRVAEIGKHPIAHILREEAIEPGDGTGAGLLEGSENASILFRIEVTR
nr:hypothetical protein [Microvirga ossetica]